MPTPPGNTPSKLVPRLVVVLVVLGVLMTGCANVGPFDFKPRPQPTPVPTLNYMSEYHHYLTDLKTAAGFLPLNQWKNDVTTPDQQNPFTLGPDVIGRMIDTTSGDGRTRFQVTTYTIDYPRDKGVRFPDPGAQALKVKAYLESKGFTVSGFDHMGSDQDKYPSTEFTGTSPTGNMFGYGIYKYGATIDSYGRYFILDGPFPTFSPAPTP